MRLMRNVIFQSGKKRSHLNSVPVNDNLGPSPPYPLKASNLKTQAKAQL